MEAKDFEKQLEFKKREIENLRRDIIEKIKLEVGVCLIMIDGDQAYLDVSEYSLPCFPMFPLNSFIERIYPSGNILLEGEEETSGNLDNYTPELLIEILTAIES